MVYFDQIKVRVPAISALSMMSGGTRVSRPRKNKPVVAMSRCTAANRKYKRVSKCGEVKLGDDTEPKKWQTETFFIVRACGSDKRTF